MIINLILHLISIDLHSVVFLLSDCEHAQIADMIHHLTWVLSRYMIDRKGAGLRVRTLQPVNQISILITLDVHGHNFSLQCYDIQFILINEKNHLDVLASKGFVISYIRPAQGAHRVPSWVCYGYTCTYVVLERPWTCETALKYFNKV